MIGGNQIGVSTISLGRLQYIRRGTAGLTERRISVKIIYLVERTYLFKISNLVLGGEGIVTDLYSRLEG
jgi:hypothetical protein